MKYELIREMQFYRSDKSIVTLKVGSTYPVATRNQIPPAMIYGQKRFEQRKKCRSVILFAEGQLRYFVIGKDVVIKL